MQVILTEQEYNELLYKTMAHKESDVSKIEKENIELRNQLKVFTKGYRNAKVSKGDIALDPLNCMDKVSLTYDLQDLPDFMQFDIAAKVQR